jgi:hypothetical protein
MLGDANTAAATAAVVLEEWPLVAGAVVEDAEHACVVARRGDIELT